jgi:hypothetical protein
VFNRTASALVSECRFISTTSPSLALTVRPPLAEQSLCLYRDLHCTGEHDDEGSFQKNGDLRSGENFQTEKNFRAAGSWRRA